MPQPAPQSLPRAPTGGAERHLLLAAGLCLLLAAPSHAFTPAAPLGLRPRAAVRARPQPRLALSLLKAQQNPWDPYPGGERRGAGRNAFEALASSLQEALGRFGAGELKEEGGAEPPSWPSLLAVPLWGALIGCALFLPSPEIVEAAMAQAGGAVEGGASALLLAVRDIPNLNSGGLSLEQLSNPKLDPSTFVPVCGFSDNFYRAAKNAVYTLAGKETYEEYAPLIAGSLLRVRLEFCVLESFVYESIIPFIKARGLSWVFPVKETLETFVAGVVFAVASNLVLIGSTKIITILVSYIDFFFGLPLRLIFGFTNDRLVQFKADKNPVGSVFVVTTGAAKLVGQVSGVARRFVEGADIFVGRYLLLTTVGYVILKFLKFKGVLTIDSVADFASGLINVFQTTPPPV